MGRTRVVILSVASLAIVGACGDDGGTAAGDGGPGGDGGGGPDAPPLGGVTCDPLPMPAGRIVDVTPAQAGQLGAIALAAEDGDVIRLADGTYDVSADVVMQLVAPNVTLISASRDASKVILDGGAHAAREIIQIGASNVTVAHLTIRNARDHHLHFTPRGADITGGTVYGVVLVDGGQQFLKSNPDAGDHHVDGITVACSTFTMTAQGRAYVPQNPSNSGYPCYTGGIDAHAARDWVVRGNRFAGIYCDVASLAEHAIHFWRGGRDQLIENNTIVDCARGIGLGLGATANGGYVRVYPDDPFAADRIDPYVGNYGGLVRNNMILTQTSGTTDVGIGLEQALGVRVLHNTVVLTGGATGNAIEYRFANSLADLRNNIATQIVRRDDARGTVESNQLQPPIGQFVDAAGGDLHLAAGAIGALDQGTPLAEVMADLDGEPRGTPTDLGADERP